MLGLMMAGPILNEVMQKMQQQQGSEGADASQGGQDPGQKLFEQVLQGEQKG
jgi:hypothetical protein